MEDSLDLVSGPNFSKDDSTGPKKKKRLNGCLRYLALVVFDESRIRITLVFGRT